MRYKIFLIITLSIFLVSCNGKPSLKETGRKPILEGNEFVINIKLGDERTIHFSKDIPYITESSVTASLVDALSRQILNINDVISHLELLITYKDGGSKFYEYKSQNKIFGDEDFYLLSCNTVSKFTDVFIAFDKEILEDKCVNENVN